MRLISISNYSEYISNMVLENEDTQVLMNVKSLNNIHYADDIVVFANSIKILQELMNRLFKANAEHRISL